MCTDREQRKDKCYVKNQSMIDQRGPGQAQWENQTEDTGGKETPLKQGEKEREYRYYQNQEQK